MQNHKTTVYIYSSKYNLKKKSQTIKNCFNFTSPMTKKSRKKDLIFPQRTIIVADKGEEGKWKV